MALVQINQLMLINQDKKCKLFCKQMACPCCDTKDWWMWSSFWKLFRLSGGRNEIFGQ
jgi:hypothetical protein